MRFVSRAAVALALVVLARPAAAQLQPTATPGTAFDSARYVPPAPLLTFHDPDTLPCPQCNPKKHFWVGAAELVAVNVIPNLVSRARGAEWAEFTPKTWGDNLTLPWQWDNNAFLNNQFSHPYHGGLYFNAARTNGYNFWQSAPWSFVGSLTWELFGEVWAPAPNDLLNTTLGGITLGEMLYRVSSLTLKNESHGFDRVVREVTAGLLNPVRGFNRVVRGEAWQVSRTPPEWRPSTILGSVDVGYRRFSASDNLGASDALDQAYVGAELLYGSEIRDTRKAPFSYFRVRGALASNNGDAGRLTELVVRGSLASKFLGDTTGLKQATLFMTYNYINNPVVAFGGQGFSAGPIWNGRASHGPWFHGEVLGAFMPIAAVGSDYYLTAEGRDYDYGIGMGATSAGWMAWPGKAVLTGSAQYVYVPVISGFPGNHQILVLSGSGRAYYKGRIGVGVDYRRLWRWSDYYGRGPVDRDASEIRLFISTALPRWESH